MLASFDLLETSIKDVVINSCRNSLTAFKIEHRIPNENSNEQNQPLLIGDEQKKDMPYTQEATIKTHYKRLRRYVKLVDYVTFHSKCQMITHSTDVLSLHLDEFISKPLNQRGSPWLITKVTNTDDSLDFKPNQTQSLELLEDIVTEGVQSICTK